MKRLDRGILETVKQEMETMDAASLIFSNMPEYKVTDRGREFIEKILKSQAMKTIAPDD